MPNKLLITGIYGGIGAVCRYLLGIIIPTSSFVSITIINMIAIILMGLTVRRLSSANIQKYHTGFLGGFSTLSSLYLFQYSIIGISINVLLGLSIYKVLTKNNN